MKFCKVRGGWGYSVRIFARFLFIQTNLFCLNHFSYVHSCKQLTLSDLKKGGGGGGGGDCFSSVTFHRDNILN